VQSLGPSTIKIADAELLHIPMASFDLYVTPLVSKLCFVRSGIQNEEEVKALLR